SMAAATHHGPFTKDFVKFLKRNPERNEYALSAYEEYGQSGTFGGRHSEETVRINSHPVVFVHGNSDSALWYSSVATGWTKSIELFKEKGYQGVELYGLTYGSRNISNSLHNAITCRNLVGLRRFIEAVLAYTQAEKIDIIAHSMGVSLARKAVQGGMRRHTVPCVVVLPLPYPQVDALVAISGANFGMCMCLVTNLTGVNACGPEGFTPGTCGRETSSSIVASCSEETQCHQDDYASVLRLINKGKKEATFVASLWSNEDLVIGKNNFAWGRKTSEVPHSDYTHAYENYNHFETKDLTAIDQYNLVSVHKRHPRSKRFY
ncbi:hypothetical protein PENTCL1PPCAC_27338, partial [Pristionchus entomophagus]